MSINSGRLLGLFKKLVETDSPTGKERNICDIVKNELNTIGINVVEDNAGDYINGNSGNLYAYIDGDLDLPPILLSSHMDTVEPSSNKKCIIDSDGKIHSDGTTVLGADDLAGISAIIESVRALKESGESHRPIELLFSVSEENYCKGVSHFDFSKIKSREAYVFDLDGEVGTAAYAAPTILSFTANIIGKASHAGFAPEKGIHSIKIACDAITKINCGRLDDDTTVNIGTISGGASTNIVPDSCTITGEIRSYNDDKAVAQYKKIFDIITQSSDEYGAKSEISFTRNVTAYETDIHHSVVDRFVKACDNLNIKSKLIRSFGGSDNNVMAQNSITGIVVATAMNNCHSTSEWTTTDELINATSVALELLRSTK